MLNRELKVDIVKKNRNGTETATEPDTTFEVKALFVSKLVEENVQKIMIGVFGYVLLDTFRKVVVASVSKSSRK
jgi:hypothetical protein